MMTRWVIHQRYYVFLFIALLVHIAMNATIAAGSGELLKIVDNLAQDVEALRNFQLELDKRTQDIPPPADEQPSDTNPPLVDSKSPIKPKLGTSNFNAYKKAQSLVRTDPKGAIIALTQYLNDYPNSSLAANALYWTGEAKYSLRNFQGAVDEFVKVLKRYKTSNKAPDAALKLGYSFYEMRNWEFARNTLEDVVKFFPKSYAASLAKKRLEKMKSQGH